MPREESPRVRGSSLLALSAGALPILVRVSACNRPCGHEGGDFYDLLPFDRDHLGVFIGDVSGHGPQVVPVARITRDLMRLQARRFGVSDPASMVQSLNRDLCERLPPSTFVTAVFGILHRPSGAFRFVRAGHCAPLLLGGGAPRPLSPAGIALGLDPGPLFREHLDSERVVFRRGERLLLYTDGLVEAWDPARGAFGRDRLALSFARHATEEGEERCVSGILRDWRRHLGDAEPDDDATIILLHGAEPHRRHRSPGATPADDSPTPPARSTDPRPGL